MSPALLFTAALLQAAPTPARPQPGTPAPTRPAIAAGSTEASDGRCLVAFAAVGSGGNAEQQNAAKLGALYFYGKLVGRNPRIDLAAAMRASATAVQSQLQAEITRCAGELQGAGGAMQAAGAALAAR